jgi:hypothetical protein
MFGLRDLALGGHRRGPRQIGQPQRAALVDGLGQQRQIDMTGGAPGGRQFLDKGEQQWI